MGKVPGSKGQPLLLLLLLLPSPTKFHLDLDFLLGMSVCDGGYCSLPPLLFSRFSCRASELRTRWGCGDSSTWEKPRSAKSVTRQSFPPVSIFRIR
eukprot:767231-Hanusia_phi.AAC.3